MKLTLKRHAVDVEMVEMYYTFNKHQYLAAVMNEEVFTLNPIIGEALNASDEIEVEMNLVSE